MRDNLFAVCVQFAHYLRLNKQSYVLTDQNVKHVLCMIFNDVLNYAFNYVLIMFFLTMFLL